MPDHTVLYLTARTEDEAHFLAGLLNSGPGRAALYSASVGVQTQRYFPTDVSRVLLPDFDAKDRKHRRIVELSGKLHELASTDTRQGDVELEGRLSQAASELWGLDASDSAAVMDYYQDLKQFRRRTCAEDGGEGGPDEE